MTAGEQLAHLHAKVTATTTAFEPQLQSSDPVPLVQPLCRLVQRISTISLQHRRDIISLEHRRDIISQTTNRYELRTAGLIL